MTDPGPRTYRDLAELLFPGRISVMFRMNLAHVQSKKEALRRATPNCAPRTRRLAVGVHEGETYTW